MQPLFGKMNDNLYFVYLNAIQNNGIETPAQQVGTIINLGPDQGGWAYLPAVVGFAFPLEDMQHIVRAMEQFAAEHQD